MSDTYGGRASDHPGAELLLFVTDEASAAQRAAVTAHLTRCAECRASLRDLRETCIELAAQPLDDMSDPAWDRALRAAIPPRFSRSVDRGSWRSSRAVGAGLFAAALLVAAVLALTVSSARQGREVERLHAELRETRAMAVVALLREPESAERLRGVALGEPLLADDARVAAAFVTALRSDPSPNVRLAVLDAVDGAPRHAQLAAEILRALPDEAQPAVRLAMIELVAEFGGADARDALNAVAHGDPDPAVRARARAAADRLSPRTPGVRQ
jgi:hypothetical protein